MGVTVTRLESVNRVFHRRSSDLLLEYKQHNNPQIYIYLHVFG